MATADLHIPRHVSLHGASKRNRSRLDIISAAVLVAFCSAAVVFSLLCQAEVRLPVSDVRAQSAATNTPLLPLNPTTAPPSQIPGAVAHNHGQLLALERAADRNYTEFSVTRSVSFQPVGPIELGFWRTNTKHDAIDGSVLVGNRRFDLSHVRLNERVLIPVSNSENLELVVNHLSKNQITGYVSEPKNASSQITRGGHSRVH